MTLRKHLLSIAVSALVLSAPAAGRAQQCRTPDPRPPAGRVWNGPLASPITLHEDQPVPLRSALDALARAAGIRLSYSAESVPLERPVCIAFDSTALGDALLILLDSVAVVPRLAGNDLVVLVPSSGAADRPHGQGNVVFPLDPVIVAVDPTDIGSAPSAVGIDVIGGRDLRRSADRSLGNAVNLAVPGIWAWQPSPTGLTIQYGSLRGASSLGLGAPKVLIDGVEVANPLLLARIAPESIERIEIIRGPQAAAFYGGGAISGVTNIVLRHGAGAGRPTFRVRSGFDIGSSRFADGSTLGHDHAISMEAGSPSRSGRLGISASRGGEVVDGATSTSLGADATGFLSGRRGSILGSFRFSGDRAGVPASPILTRAGTLDGESPDVATGTNVSLRQYTASLRASFRTGSRWSHSIVAGIDGYDMGRVENNPFPFEAVAADTVLSAAGTAAFRGTARLASRVRLGETDVTRTELTLALEHTAFHQKGTLDGWNEARTAAADSSVVAFDDEVVESTRTSLHATGASALLGAAVNDRLHLAAGIRLEYGAPGGTDGRLSALPMIGGSHTTRIGDATIELHAAWGRGIRWPRMAVHEDADDFLAPGANLDISPETQTGFEGGADVSFSRGVRFEVTRFDQTATGLIQGAAIHDPVTGEPEAFAYENVGAAENAGWEFEASLRRGFLSLAASLSLVNSRVTRLADAYIGDLRPGDRLLGVPARTASFAASWIAPRWSASVGAWRAADWINYDRVALARNAAEGGVPSGTGLRDFWIEYPGITHLRVTLSRDLRPGLSLFLIGSNLVGHQVGEPDNGSVLPGRSFGLGLRATF